MNEKNKDNPILLFQEWLAEAEKSEINDPNAMSLATCTKNGIPSVRIVLLKQADESGFKFHTNSKSQKGIELAENPNAALCFHWKSLRKQIRIEGKIETVSIKEADEYFTTRPYSRQVGAWASQQSRPLESREHLEKKLDTLRKTYPKGTTVPRPDYWVGYRLPPQKIEFWWDNEDRLHDRLLYTHLDNGNWNKTRLYP